MNGREVLQRILHLLVLSSLTVAQPMLDLLSRNHEFFVIRRLDRFEILTLVFVLLVVVPLPPIAVETLLIRAPRWLQRSVHLVFVGLFGSLLGMLILRRVEGLPPVAALLSAALLGTAATFVYARVSAARTFVGLLSIGLVAIPLMFALNPQVSRLLSRQHASSLDLPPLTTTSPIVFIVFDEFSQLVLLDADLQINRYRYPHLAALADRSTWYANVIAAAENTASAVPAILTGIEPVAQKVPSIEDHPNNLFTAFGGSYELWVEEPATHLCRAEINHRETIETPWMERFRYLASDLKIVYLHLLLPPSWSDELPAISSGWSGFGRSGEARPIPPDDGADARAPFFRLAKNALKEDRRLEMDHFVEVASDASSSQLFFIHVMLPHRPWELLPDGRRYTPEGRNPSGLTKEGWSEDVQFVGQALQRYIMQAMYVDRIVGRLVGKLEASGRFDETLMVLVADHGFSFSPGEHHRLVSEDNAHGILMVPLLIKAPYQTEGRVVGQRASTLDVLPTVFEILGEEQPWPMDGVSRTAGAERAPAPIRFFSKKRGFVALEPSALRPRKGFVNSMLRSFGDGSDPEEIYRFGPVPELFKRTTAEIEIGPPMSWGLRIKDRDAYAEVDLAAPVLPALLKGAVRPPRGAKTGHKLAVAMNGVVVATTTTFAFRKRWQGFTAMLPPSAFRQGANTIEVFKIDRRLGEPVLWPLQLN